MGKQRTDTGPSAFGRFVLGCRARPVATLVLIGGLAAVAYLSTHLFWPSDAQRAKWAVSGLLSALKREDVPAVLERVSPYFSEEGLDKTAVGEMLGHVLGRQDFLRANVTFQQIQVLQGRAAMKLYVRSFHRGDFGAGMVNSEWIVTLEEIRGRWLIRGATPIGVNGRRVAGLRAVLAAGY
jgi:hypothetical protein